MLFSNDAKLSSLIAQVLVILTGYVIFDGTSAMLGGVVKGVGKQLVATPIVFFSYYAVGLPLAARFAFRLKWGVRGLCLGMLVGTAVHAVCFFVLVWFMDWDLEAQKAATRVGLSKRVDESMEGLLDGQHDRCEDDLEEEERESTRLLATEDANDVKQSQSRGTENAAQASSV